MTTIENKETALQLVEGKSATYGDLLLHLLSRPVPNPIGMKEMRRDLKLMDILEIAGDEFEVSADDAKYLADLALKSEWHGRHKDLLAFYSYFEAIADGTSN